MRRRLLVASIPATRPFLFGAVFSAVKTSFADQLVQRVVERKAEIDWKRNAAFALFGGVYLGGVQYAIYVPFFTRIFPKAESFAAKPFKRKLKDSAGLLQLAAQVVLGQFVFDPLLYFPCFYCTKELVAASCATDETKSNSPGSENSTVLSNVVSSGLSAYRANWKEDLVAMWQVWVPATVVNFACMPMHARIPFMASLSLLWTCKLSIMRGDAAADGSGGSGDAEKGWNRNGRATRYDVETATSEYVGDPADTTLLVGGGSFPGANDRIRPTSGTNHNEAFRLVQSQLL